MRVQKHRSPSLSLGVQRELEVDDLELVLEHFLEQSPQAGHIQLAGTQRENRPPHGLVRMETKRLEKRRIGRSHCAGRS